MAPIKPTYEFPGRKVTSPAFPAELEEAEVDEGEALPVLELLTVLDLVVVKVLPEEVMVDTIAVMVALALALALLPLAAAESVAVGVPTPELK